MAIFCQRHLSLIMSFVSTVKEILFVLILIIFSGASLVEAYEARIYEVNDVDGSELLFSENGHDILWAGELKGVPHMYTIEPDATSTVKITLKALSETATSNISVLVVKENKPRGVVAVARQEAKETNWLAGTDSLSRVDYLEGGTFEQELAPGFYRLEVSSPNNQGKYLLMLHGQTENSWWGKVSSAMTIQDFADYSYFNLLFSPLLVKPFLILLAILGGFAYSRRKKLFK